MGQALYRKYRSKNLSEIVGQSHVVEILKRAIELDKISHAYLLTGPRGVGKTSIARILAHEINNLPYTDDTNHLDIIEIDAASNNSVDDIRDLRDKVQIAPSIAKKKIYIIDEVHMLSKQAFNALLKTLEEPPAHVVFILATTDADKLPPTVISRVQRFNFRSISTSDAVSHLRIIAEAEAISIEDEALQLIAKSGKGSFRDSIGLLDQLQNLNQDTITKAYVEKILGLADHELTNQLIEARLASDINEIVRLLDHSQELGISPNILAHQLIETCRDRITEKPSLIALLDRLTDVDGSAWPDIKLLTTLTSDIEYDKNPEPLAESKPVKKPIAPAPKVDASPALTPEANTPPSPATQEKKLAKKSTAGKAVSFDWQNFIDQVKAESSGVGLLVSKLAHSIQDNDLHIYAGKKFTRNQITKSLPLMKDIYEKNGGSGEVIVTEDLPPSTNSDTASVLSIMGGGEEVKI